MSVIYIEKLNEATLRVYSDDYGVEMELSEFFKFRPAGYQFSPKFKSRIWDGFVYMYSVHKKHLPYGLLPYVKKFAEANDYVVEIKSDLNHSISVSTDVVKSFVEDLNLHTGGKKISMRDYQIDAVVKALSKGRCITKSPTGSGKSGIIYSYVRYMLSRGEKIILIVPTTSLVNQMFSDFQDYSSENGWDVSAHCQKLYSGQERIFDKDVLITTWQSLHSMSKTKTKEMQQFFARYSVLIGDEAHKFSSTALISVMNRLVNTKYRLGTTGTVQDDKVSKLTLEGAFGPIFDITSTKKLIENKQLVDLNIKCLILDYPEETKKLFKKAEYTKEMDYIVTNEARRKFVSKMALVCKGNTLVLFQFVQKHGIPLYNMIKEMAPDRPVYLIYGDVSPEERERIRKVLSTHSDAIIVASAATMSTGVNIPSIENIIFSSPSKSKINNLQSIGRGLRLKEGKTSCNLFDIADNLSYKSHINHTMKHLKERIDIYTSEQFEFSIKQVDFKP